jgi:hypothetical protein
MWGVDFQMGPPDRSKQAAEGSFSSKKVGKLTFVVVSQTPTTQRAMAVEAIDIAFRLPQRRICHPIPDIT